MTETEYGAVLILDVDAIRQRWGLAAGKVAPIPVSGMPIAVFPLDERPWWANRPTDAGVPSLSTDLVLVDWLHSWGDMFVPTGDGAKEARKRLAAHRLGGHIDDGASVSFDRTYTPAPFLLCRLPEHTKLGKHSYLRAYLDRQLFRAPT